jgi:tetratricopeptide (TPR) repeat protein
VILDPRHSHAFNNLGYVLLQAGEPERAIAPLARAVELAPHLAFVRNNLGVAYQRAGRLEEARVQFAAADDLSPGRTADLERVAEAIGSGEAPPDAPEAARGDEAACARDPMRPGPRMTAHSLLFGRPSDDEAADCE